MEVRGRERVSPEPSHKRVDMGMGEPEIGNGTLPAEVARNLLPHPLHKPHPHHTHSDHTHSLTWPWNPLRAVTSSRLRPLSLASSRSTSWSDDKPRPLSAHPSTKVSQRDHSGLGVAVPLRWERAELALSLSVTTVSWTSCRILEHTHTHTSRE